MRLMHDDVYPVLEEAVIRRQVAARAAQLRRHRRARRAAMPVVAGLIVAVLLAEGMPTGLRTTAPSVPPAQDGADQQAGSVPGSTVVAGAPGRGLDSVGSSGPSSLSPSTAEDPDGSVDAEQQPSARLPRTAVVRRTGLWELLTNGSVVRRLVEADAESPSWSPNGRLVAYTDTSSHGPVGDRILVLDTESWQQAHAVGYVDHDCDDAAWSPDGQWLALTRRPRVDTGAPAVGPTVLIRAADGSGEDSIGAGERPAWSPDGRLALRKTGQLWIHQSGASWPIPQSTGLDSPAWSPDGRWIAALDDAGRLAVLRPDGTARRVVVEGATGRPAWFPDGSRLLYPTAAGLRSIRPDGSEAVRVTDMSDDRDIALVAA